MFFCERFQKVMKRLVEPMEELNDLIKTYLENKLCARDGCEVAVTARVRMSWVKFGECGVQLKGKGFHCRWKRRHIEVV